MRCFVKRKSGIACTTFQILYSSVTFFGKNCVNKYRGKCYEDEIGKVVCKSELEV